MKRYIILSTLITILFLSSYDAFSQAIVYVKVKDFLNLRADANTKSSIILKLYNGDECILLARTKEKFKIDEIGSYYWYKVKTRSDKVGWVFGAYLSTQKPEISSNLNSKQFAEILYYTNNETDIEKKKAILLSLLKKFNSELKDYESFKKNLTEKPSLAEEVSDELEKLASKDKNKTYPDDPTVSNDLYGIWTVSLPILSEKGEKEDLVLFYISFGEPKDNIGEVRIANIQSSFDVFTQTIPSTSSYKLEKGTEYIGYYMFSGYDKMHINAKGIGSNKSTYFTISSINWIENDKITAILGNTNQVIFLKKNN